MLSISPVGQAAVSRLRLVLSKSISSNSRTEQTRQDQEASGDNIIMKPMRCLALNLFVNNVHSTVILW